MPIFQTPETIITGIGCFDKIGEYACRFGSMCLLVTGEKSMQEQGIFDKAIHLLGEAGVRTVACAGVEHDPDLATVDTAREALKRNSCDLVIGLGGGSSLDVAKAAAGLANESEPTSAFFQGREISGTGIPVIAVPSTFGTGSEATRVSVLSDHDNKIKKSIRHDCMLPKVCMVDPIIGTNTPPAITAACGMDALTQAIESYLSIHATDLTRSLSFSAIVLLVAGLERAFRDGHDIEARENCANGSLMAGIALHNARLGLVHGIAHPLGIHYNIAHGKACGILLPHVLRYNREKAGENYRLLSGILGKDAADFCEELLIKLNLPTDFKWAKIPETDFAMIAELTMPSGSTRSNPRRVTEDDVVEMLRAIA